MIGVGLTVSAAELLNCSASLEPSNNIVTIKGKHSLLNNGYVTVTVTSENGEIFRNEGYVATNGEFEYKFSMNENDVTGLYRVTMNGNSIAVPVALSYGFASSQAIQALLGSLENTNDVKALFSGNEMVYGLDIESNYFKLLSNTDGIYAVLRRKFNSLSELQAQFNTAVGISNFNKVSSKDTSLVEYFKTALSLKTDETSYYGMLADKQILVETMTGKMFSITNLPLFQETFDKASALMLVNSFDTSMRDKVQSITQKLINDGYISATISGLTNNAIKELIDLKPYSSLADYQSKVISAIEKANTPTNTGGNSGGNTVSGSAVVSNIPKVESETKDAFKDINSVPWAVTAITDLYHKGVVAGIGDGTFEPLRNVTRAEFVKMLVIAFQFNIMDTDAGFSDINTSDWCSKYVSTAKQNDLVKGVSETEFGANTLINREQMATMLHRAIISKGHELELSEATISFLDESDISSYSKEAINYLCKSGAINGVGDNKFAPFGNATRAMSAKAIYEVLGRFK